MAQRVTPLRTSGHAPLAAQRIQTGTHSALYVVRVLDLHKVCGNSCLPPQLTLVVPFSPRILDLLSLYVNEAGVVSC
jgi:hypothetical protein